MDYWIGGPDAEAGQGLARGMLDAGNWIDGFPASPACAALPPRPV
jgi:hypothetical protein